MPDEVFMVAELSPGALRGRGGLVKYHPEFGNVTSAREQIARTASK